MPIHPTFVVYDQYQVKALKFLFLPSWASCLSSLCSFSILSSSWQEKKDGLAMMPLQAFRILIACLEIGSRPRPRSHLVLVQIFTAFRRRKMDVWSDRGDLKDSDFTTVCEH
jgi:hypothetical protein